MPSFKKISSLNNDTFIPLLIAIFFLIFTITLPIYDNVNGFHNLLFDNYSLTWYDGKSSANFHITKNIIENGSFSFPKGYLIDNIKVENMVDFFEKNGTFYPLFNVLPNYLYANVLYFFSSLSNLQFFKVMITLTMLISTFILIIFYKVQRLLGLNTKYSIISTSISGIATSILIYSRYLFIDHTLNGLIFILMIYFILKNFKNKFPKNNIIIALLFSFYLILLSYYIVIFIILTALSYFLIKHKLITSKFLMITLIITILFIIWVEFLYTNLMTPGDIPFFKVFPNYLNALDYSVFGYHNQTSQWKISREFAYIYVFEQLKGNAIFLASYSLFGTLFGPRGFVFNSPYLIFSILGIFIYNKKKEKKLLLTIIVLIILIYALFHLRWQGGYSPRYIRYYTIPVLFLTFFSFYYIQETKNNLVKLIFLALVIISILNVTSLAVRADWTYEHEADLVSYDLVLWPWYPSKGINLELSSVLWNENQLCPNYYYPNEVVLDVCNCAESGFISKELIIKKEYKNLEIIGCAQFSGGDGVYSKISIDSDVVHKGFIQWNQCDRIVIDISKYADDKQHLLNISIDKFGACDVELIQYKRVAFIE